MFRRLHLRYLLLICLLGVSWSPDLFAAGWKRQKAVTFPEKVLLRINEKPRAYYRAQAGDTIEYEITGPSLMHVISRIQLEEKSSREKYQYLLQTGDERADRFKHRTRLSKISEYNDQIIGESRRKTVEIPEGTHKYRIIVPNDDSHTFYFRVTVRSRNPLGKRRLVSLEPDYFISNRDVIVKERPYTYYGLRTKDSLTVRVIGPTIMKVISRLAFDDKMMGTRSYRVKVYEDAGLKNTYMMQTSRSQVAYFDAHSDLVPGKGVGFYVTVPGGEHHYRFQFVDGNQQVFLKCYIPASDLKPESDR